MTDTQGRIVWHEYQGADTGKAMDFYTRLAGWTVKMPKPGTEPYYELMNDGTPIAGIMKLPEEASRHGATSHWMMYVGVDDVDATVAMAAKLGGRTHLPPIDMAGVGRFAVLADPQGATFALYKPARERATGDEETPPGGFMWDELATDDRVAAMSFYWKLFGWEERGTMEMGELGTYQMFGRQGSERMLGGMFDRSSDMPASFWTGYIRVKNLDASMEKAKALGGTALKAMDIPRGRFSICTDPLGAIFALIEVK